MGRFPTLNRSPVFVVYNNFHRSSLAVSSSDKLDPATNVDVREEYANAFRTESYLDFWTRMLALTTANSTTCLPVVSTTAARLPSYRLFTEQLLDPDQPTVTRILSVAQISSENHSLVFWYFQITVYASLLCGLLLKQVGQISDRYRFFKASMSAHIAMFDEMLEFSRSVNPFVSSTSYLGRFQPIQADCCKLLKDLKSSRDNTQAKLRFIDTTKHSLATLLIAFLFSLS